MSEYVQILNWRWCPAKRTAQLMGAFQNAAHDNCRATHTPIFQPDWAVITPDGDLTSALVGDPVIIRGKLDSTSVDGASFVTFHSYYGHPVKVRMSDADIVGLAPKTRPADPVLGANQFLRDKNSKDWERLPNGRYHMTTPNNSGQTLTWEQLWDEVGPVTVYSGELIDNEKR